MARLATPPYRAGIVGIRGPTGGIGGRHARAARTHGAHVVAICDLNHAPVSQAVAAAGTA